MFESRGSRSGTAVHGRDGPRRLGAVAERGWPPPPWPSVPVTVSLQSAAVASGTWSPPTSVDSGASPTSVSCPTVKFCIAVDDTGNAVIHKRNNTWETPDLVDAAGGGLASVSCASTTSAWPWTASATRSVTPTATGSRRSPSIPGSLSTQCRAKNTGCAWSSTTAGMRWLRRDRVGRAHGHRLDDSTGRGVVPDGDLLRRRRQQRQRPLLQRHGLERPDEYRHRCHPGIAVVRHGHTVCGRRRRRARAQLQRCHLVGSHRRRFRCRARLGVVRDDDVVRGGRQQRERPDLRRPAWSAPSTIDSGTCVDVGVVPDGELLCRRGLDRGGADLPAPHRDHHGVAPGGNGAPPYSVTLGATGGNPPYKWLATLPRDSASAGPPG